MLVKFKHFDSVADIATQYDLFNLIPDPIREVGISLSATCIQLYNVYN